MEKQICPRCQQEIVDGQLVTSDFTKHINCPDSALLEYAPAEVPTGHYKIAVA